MNYIFMLLLSEKNLNLPPLLCIILAHRSRSLAVTGCVQFYKRRRLRNFSTSVPIFIMAAMKTWLTPHPPPCLANKTINLKKHLGFLYLMRCFPFISILRALMPFFNDKCVSRDVKKKKIFLKSPRTLCGVS